jgi:4-hydroxythreonine-4-phosphate dehydrogenase
MTKPVLGLLLGDAAGIGPEIVAKLCTKDTLFRTCRPVVIGDLRVMKKGQQIAGVSFPLQVIDAVAAATWQDGVPFLD